MTKKMTGAQKYELNGIIHSVYSRVDAKIISERLGFHTVHKTYNIEFGGYYQASVINETEKAYQFELLVGYRQNSSFIVEPRNVWVPKSAIKKQYYFREKNILGSDSEMLIKLPKWLIASKKI
jgi:hypothetical protein